MALSSARPKTGAVTFHLAKYLRTLFILTRERGSYLAIPDCLQSQIVCNLVGGVGKSRDSWENQKLPL